MKMWRRTHKYGAIKTLLIGQGDSNLYRIIVHEPRGEYRIRDDHEVTNLLTGKRIADELVQKHYPHHCEVGECSGWETQ